MPTISPEEAHERDLYEQTLRDREERSREENDLPMCEACKERPVVDYGCHFCEKHQRPYNARLSESRYDND